MIEKNLKLHGRWEKVVFGKPIECYDFFDGFASVAHRLVVGAGEPKGDRFLRFTISKGRKEWRERFNHDVGAFFSAMYRGLRELMGAKVDWRLERMGTADLPDPLFNYPAFFAKEKEIRGDKLKQVTSLAKNSVQIKFEVSLIERIGEIETILEKTPLLSKTESDVEPTAGVV